MIYIIKDTPSIVCETLAGLHELDVPYYLFEIISDFNTDAAVTYVHYADENNNGERFAQFTFDLDLPQGQYTYNIYESATPNPAVIADTTGEIIKTGILIVDSTEDLTSDIYL